MLIKVITYVLLSWQVAHWGGNFNNGANSGLWYANFNNSSGANTNTVAQLSLYIKNIMPICNNLGSCQNITNRNYSASSNMRKLSVVQANMKRYNNLFKEVVSIENLQLAYNNAKKGKRNYREVKMIEKNPDFYINEIRETLISGNYKNSEYQIFEKNTGQKIRKIYKLPFYPDRIVHHAIVQVCEPIWTKLFIKHTFANLPKRGIPAGDSIPLDKVLDTKLIIIAFRISKSKFDGGNGKCLTIQVEINDIRHVIFTGSGVLTKQLEKYENQLPFLAQINKSGNYYTLT